MFIGNFWEVSVWISYLAHHLLEFHDRTIQVRNKLILEIERFYAARIFIESGNCLLWVFSNWFTARVLIFFLKNSFIMCKQYQPMTRKKWIQISWILHYGRHESFISSAAAIRQMGNTAWTGSQMGYNGQTVKIPQQEKPEQPTKLDQASFLSISS